MEYIVKKVIIVISMLMFLSMTTFSWSRRPENVFVYNEQRVEQEIAHQDLRSFSMLGTPAWQSETNQRDRHLDQLCSELDRGGDDQLMSVLPLYKESLEAYFQNICSEVQTVIRCVDLFDFLNHRDREVMASRLKNVVVEHRQFLQSPPHTHNLTRFLGYSHQDIQEVLERVGILDDAFSDILPHEADNASDIGEESDCNE